MRTSSSPAGSLGATALALSGLALAGFPLLRPWGAESGPDGVALFGSLRWPVSHLVGVLGFVALALGLRVVAATSGDVRLRRAETLAWVATALLLPYYGAEAFAGYALASHAAATGDPSVLAVLDGFRYAALPMATFGLGLLLLVPVAVLVLRTWWDAGTPARVGALLTGLGLVGYLPQFFGTPALRVGHGLLLGGGLLLLAAVALRTTVSSGPPTGAQPVVTRSARV